MDRFVRSFRRQSPIEEIIEEYAKETPESGLVAEAVVLPDGFKALKYQQSDGKLVEVRRKIPTSEGAHRDPSTSSVTPSPRGSFKNVISRTSDGRLVCVPRPIRDSIPPSRPSSRLSQARSVRRSASISSSVYSERPERDTMASTMTIVEAALAEQLSCQERQHSRKDGSATTTASGAAISGTSGDIHIGHVAEVDKNDGDAEYSAIDYDEREYSCSEDGQTGNDVAGGGDRDSEYLVLVFI